MQYSKIIYNTVFWKTFCELCVWYDHSERTKSRITREDFPRFSDVFDLLWFIFISLPYIWNSTQKSWIHFHATYFPISPPFWPSFVLNFGEASFPTLAIHYSVAAEKKKCFVPTGEQSAECTYTFSKRARVPGVLTPPFFRFSAKFQAENVEPISKVFRYIILLPPKGKSVLFRREGRVQSVGYNIHSLKEQEFPEFKRSSAKFLSRRNLSQKFFDTLFCCRRKEKVFCSNGWGECRV